MRFAFAAAVVLLASAGGAPTAAREAPATITYETGACFGTCPIYSLSLDTRSGQGEFVGRRFTAHTGPRRFTATPRQVAAFSRALAPVRALPGDLSWGKPACRNPATDMPSVTVSWRERGRVTRREVYFGCDMDANRALYERVRTAPLVLPVGDLIGKR